MATAPSPLQDTPTPQIQPQQQPGNETVDSLAQKIKDRYPDYAATDNHELVTRIINKYPEYQTRLSGDELQRLAAGSAPSAQPQPGFLARASQQMLGTQHPIDQAVSEAKQFYNDPIGTLGQATKQAAMMPVNLANDLVRHPLDTAKRLTGGDAFAEDVRNKNYAGALGTVAGGVLPIVAGSPEVRSTLGNMVKGVPEAVGDAAQATAEKVAGPIVRKPPAATANDLKFGRNPAEAITREPGLKGLTVGGLRDGVTQRMQEVGQATDDTLSTPQAKAAEPTNIAPIIDKAEKDALASPTAKLNPGLETRIGQTADALRTKFGDLTKSPLEATQMKRAIGEATKWTGQPFDNEANQFLVDVYRGIKNDVNAKVPEVAPLNERYADLLSAKSALDRKIAFDTNRPASIGRMALGAMGGGAATAAGAAVGGVPGAIAGGAVDLARTTPGRLTLGRAISRIAGQQYDMPAAPAPDLTIQPRQTLGASRMLGRGPVPMPPAADTSGPIKGAQPTILPMADNRQLPAAGRTTGPQTVAGPSQYGINLPESVTATREAAARLAQLPAGIRNLVPGRVAGAPDSALERHAILTPNGADAYILVKDNRGRFVKEYVHDTGGNSVVQNGKSYKIYRP